MMNKFGSYLKEFLEFSNISVREFAFRINTTPKNLIDILNGKIAISQNMIYNISFITGIPVSFIERLEYSYIMEKNIKSFLDDNKIKIDDFIKNFNPKELAVKYDVLYTDERNKYQILEDIMQFLRISDINLIYKNDNSIFYKSKNDKPELLALWLERCYRVVSKQSVKEYKKENIESIVNYVREQARNNSFDEESLIRVFNENGIFLAIENDLKGAKIRGAFKVLNDKPAIYITKKHKRYADIYFALLHELAHCKSDFNRAKSGSIVSLQEDNEKSDYEIRADKTAYNWMVEDGLYEKIKNNYRDINNLDVVKSFFVYRLAKDGIISYKSSIYQENNKLID